MINFLKKIRKTEYGNMLVRAALRKLQVFFSEAISRWPVYGNVDMKFQNINFKSYSEADDYLVSPLYYGKPINENDYLNCFLNFAGKSAVILDIGANVGLYSILSSKVNTNALIYAFEPNKVNAIRLRKNIEINQLRNIRLVEKAIGNTDKQIKFTVPVNNTISDTSSALEGFSETTYSGSIKWKSVDVEQITVDGFISSEGLTRVDLIKIDVEGYEIMVFEGALESIKKFQPVIQCEIFLDESRKQYFERFLKEYNYTAYILMDKWLLKFGKNIQRQNIDNFIFMKHEFPDLLTPFEKASGLIGVDQ